MLEIKWVDRDLCYSNLFGNDKYCSPILHIGIFIAHGGSRNSDFLPLVPREIFQMFPGILSLVKLPHRSQ